jgi:hypothetical protein
MNRYVAFLPGPELYWMLVFVFTRLLVLMNQPHTAEGAAKLETIGWFLAIGSVILSFLPILWIPGNHWWLLARIGLSGIIGSIVVIQHFIDKGFYPDPGVGTYGMMLIGISFIILTGAIVITAFMWVTKGQYLKWVLIGLGTIIFLGAIIFLLATMDSKNSG